MLAIQSTNEAIPRRLSELALDKPKTPKFAISHHSSTRHPRRSAASVAEAQAPIDSDNHKGRMREVLRKGVAVDFCLCFGLKAQGFRALKLARSMLKGFGF